MHPNVDLDSISIIGQGHFVRKVILYKLSNILVPLPQRNQQALSQFTWKYDSLRSGSVAAASCSCIRGARWTVFNTSVLEESMLMGDCFFPVLPPRSDHVLTARSVSLPACGVGRGEIHPVCRTSGAWSLGELEILLAVVPVYDQVLLISVSSSTKMKELKFCTCLA
eukprot:758053-Hanusia_phi.AAC.4